MKKYLYLIMTAVLCTNCFSAGIVNYDLRSGINSVFDLPFTAGNSNFLIVSISYIPGADITDASFNTQPLTPVNHAVVSNDITQYLYCFSNPVTYTVDIYFTLSGVSPALINAVSLSGIDTSNPIYFQNSIAGVNTTAIPFSINEKPGNLNFAIGASNSNVDTALYPGQIMLWNVYYSQGIKSECIYAAAQNTDTMQLQNTINSSASYSLLLLSAAGQ